MFSGNEYSNRPGSSYNVKKIVGTTLEDLNKELANRREFSKRSGNYKNKSIPEVEEEKKEQFNNEYEILEEEPRKILQEKEYPPELKEEGIIPNLTER